MAHRAQVLDFAKAHTPPATIEPHSAPVAPFANPNVQEHLLDLSVEPDVEADLARSPFRATIQIQLTDPAVRRHPNFLYFLGNHTRGRCGVHGIDNAGMLYLIYTVADDDATEHGCVEAFASGVARHLGLAECAVRSAGIERTDAERRERVMRAVGVRPPELRLV